MKVFVLLLSAVVMAAAESPVYYTNFLRFQRVKAPYPAAGARPSQELRLPEKQGYAPPSNTYGNPSGNYETPSDAYGNPSGNYGTSSDASRRYGTTTYGSPSGNYGTPSDASDKYGPPPAAYGPPTLTTTEFVSDATTTEIPTTTEVSTEEESEQIKQQGDTGEKEKVSEEEFAEQGVYYIYHPNGLLQRVVYSTRNDVQDMGYTAQLRYRDVEPIKDPIYTYDPETFVLRQITL